MLDINLYEARALRQAMRWVAVYVQGQLLEMPQTVGGGFTQKQRERWRAMVKDDRVGTQS